MEKELKELEELIIRAKKTMEEMAEEQLFIRAKKTMEEVGIEVPKFKKDGKAIITITEKEEGFALDGEITNMDGYDITQCLVEALVVVIKEYGKKECLENIVENICKNIRKGVRN